MRGLMAMVRRRVLDFDFWDERMLVLGHNLALGLTNGYRDRKEDTALRWA